MAMIYKFQYDDQYVQAEDAGLFYEFPDQEEEEAYARVLFSS